VLWANDAPQKKENKVAPKSSHFLDPWSLLFQKLRKNSVIPCKVGKRKEIAEVLTEPGYSDGIYFHGEIKHGVQ
jgi:hypothetical protein